MISSKETWYVEPDGTTRRKKKIVMVDMDDTVCDFMGASIQAIHKQPGILWPQSQYKFFENLEPIANALEAIHELQSSGKYEVWILTRPSTLNRLCYTEKAEWIFKHLGQEFVDKLILCPDKGLVKGDYLVDDVLWSAFEGEQIHYRSTEYPDWSSVLKRLL